MTTALIDFCVVLVYGYLKIAAKNQVKLSRLSDRGVGGSLGTQNHIRDYTCNPNFFDMDRRGIPHVLLLFRRFFL